jgi:hypothetical protein
MIVSYTTESVRNIALVGYGISWEDHISRSNSYTTLVDSQYQVLSRKAIRSVTLTQQERIHQHSLDSSLVNRD